MRGMKTPLDSSIEHKNPQNITEDSEHKGYLLIWDLRKKGIESVHNIFIMNTDATSYQERLLEKFLHISEN